MSTESTKPSSLHACICNRITGTYDTTYRITGTYRCTLLGMTCLEKIVDATHDFICRPSHHATQWRLSAVPGPYLSHWWKRWQCIPQVATCYRRRSTADLQCHIWLLKGFEFVKCLLRYPAHPSGCLSCHDPFHAPDGFMPVGAAEK